MSTLPALTGITMLTRWRMNWMSILLAVLAMSWYLRRHQRLAGLGGAWPTRRLVSYICGVAAYLWCTNGFLNAYSGPLLWVWAIQVLALLLAVPVLLMAAQPLELAARTSRRLHGGGIGRLFGLLFRLLAHPFLAPALVPLITGLIFFGRFADLWTSRPLMATVLGAMLLGVGCLLAAGLTIEDTTVASLAVGLALAVAVLEMLTDAIPGIVLRLDTHLLTAHFAVTRAPWAMSPLADQKLAGSILWGVAEMLDLPVLGVLFFRWVRADEREARRSAPAADREAMLKKVELAAGVEAPAAILDPPWWLADPDLSYRLGLTTRSVDDARPPSWMRS